MRPTILLLLPSVLFAVGCNRDSLSSATDTQRFSEHGVEFDYPRTMSIETMDGPVRLILLTSTDDIRVTLLVYPTRTLSPEQLQTIALANFRKSAARINGTNALREHDSERYIAGEMRTGKTFRDFADGEERITQFYTFAFATGAISAVLQNSAAVSSNAESMFDVVLRSMTAQQEEATDTGHQGWTTSPNMRSTEPPPSDSVLDAPDYSDAGFAVGVRFRRRSVS